MRLLLIIGVVGVFAGATIVGYGAFSLVSADTGGGIVNQVECERYTVTVDSGLNESYFSGSLSYSELSTSEQEVLQLAIQNGSVNSTEPIINESQITVRYENEIYQLKQNRTSENCITEVEQDRNLLFSIF